MLEQTSPTFTELHGTSPAASGKLLQTKKTGNLSGRFIGLKICRGQPHVGSTPTSATIYSLPSKINAKIRHDGAIRAEADFCRKWSKFTHFLTQFLVCYVYNADIEIVTGRRSGLKIRRRQLRGGSTPPPGTISSTNILCGFSNFAALVSTLRPECFGFATALRYEIRYSAHPIYFQQLACVCSDCISTGFSNLR